MGDNAKPQQGQPQRPQVQLDPNTPITVVATARGYFGDAIREPGDHFTVPASVFFPRPRPMFNDRGEKVATETYPQPSWFKRASKRQELPVEGGEPSDDKGNTPLA